MINFITIRNIDTTWPLPTNTNVPKHTQNSYGMYKYKYNKYRYVLLTYNKYISSNAPFVILFIYLIPFLPM